METTRQHIEYVFSESVYTMYAQRRYGLKVCGQSIPVEVISDLRDLLIYITEYNECDLNGCCPCDLQGITEKINTI